MKKLVAAIGSSRVGSVSEKVAEKVMEGAKQAGYEVVVYKIEDLNIKGCQGCGACRKNGTDCVIQDDMQAYYKDLHSCDALLVTAPNYYSQVAGHMITFMNRHYCMTNADRSSRLKPGIQLLSVFAQGAPEGYEKYKENYQWYVNTFLTKGMGDKGQLVVGGDSDLSESGEIMTKAFEMGKQLD